MKLVSKQHCTYFYFWNHVTLDPQTPAIKLFSKTQVPKNDFYAHITMVYTTIMWNTHFSQSSAEGVFADAVISSPGSWPFPFGIAFTSAEEFCTVSAGLSSLMSPQVNNILSFEKCKCLTVVSALKPKFWFSSWDLCERKKIQTINISDIQCQAVRENEKEIISLDVRRKLLPTHEGI